MPKRSRNNPETIASEARNTCCLRTLLQFPKTFASLPFFLFAFNLPAYDPLSGGCSKISLYFPSNQPILNGASVYADR